MKSHPVVYTFNNGKILCIRHLGDAVLVISGKFCEGSDVKSTLLSKLFRKVVKKVCGHKKNSKKKNFKIGMEINLIFFF